MPSSKILASVCHNIAHYATSGVSWIHPHLRIACRAAGLDSVRIDLLLADPCPAELRHVEPLRLSLIGLRERFEKILNCQGFMLGDITAAGLYFDFMPFSDDYSSNCYAKLTDKSGKVFRSGVNHLGESLTFIER